MRYVVGNTVSFGEGRGQIDRKDWVGNKTLQKPFIFNFHGAVLLQLSELNEASNQKTLWPFQLFANNDVSAQI